MDWICFGDSAKGMLAVSRLPEAPPLSQILDLSDDLSIGDLSDLHNREARAFGVCPWKNDPEFADMAQESIERYFEQAVPAFEAVSEAVIWYGDGAAEQCGMLRAAHDLTARGVPFSLVHVDALRGEELPPPKAPGAAVGVFVENRVWNAALRHVPQFLMRRMIPRMCRRVQMRRWKQRPARVVYRGVGEAGPEAAPVFYRKRRKVPACEAKLLYSRWERLVAENAPLRVMENGKLLSAPVDYYDEAIVRNTPEKETKAAWVIGRVLNEHIISDCLVFERIRALAASGRLTIVKNGGNYRETTIKKAVRG